MQIIFSFQVLLIIKKFIKIFYGEMLHNFICYSGENLLLVQQGQLVLPINI